MTPDRKERPRGNEAPKLRIGQPFNPYKLFTGIFIPEALVRYRGLGCGAKIAYGRLARYAGENGACFPSVPKLAIEMGIGATQARIYVHELSKKRFIAIEQRPGTSGVYTFLWHAAFAGEVGDKRKAPPLQQTGGVPPRKAGDVPLRKTGPLPLRKTGDEENHHQESQIKESQSKGSQTCALRASVGLGEAGSKNSFSVDDDEKPPQPQYRSPWEELRAQFAKANGGAEMGFQDNCWLKDQMELRRITPEGLLELVRKNPLSGFRSPMAGLKWLVKKFGTKTRSADEQAAAAEIALGTFSPLVVATRCEKCGGTGRILERVKLQRPIMTDQYCGCRMGKDLEIVERRKRKASGGSDTQVAHPKPPGGLGGADTQTAAYHADH